MSIRAAPAKLPRIRTRLPDVAPVAGAWLGATMGRPPADPERSDDGALARLAVEIGALRSDLDRARDEREVLVAAGFDDRDVDAYRARGEPNRVGVETVMAGSPAERAGCSRARIGTIAGAVARRPVAGATAGRGGAVLASRSLGGGPATSTRPRRDGRSDMRALVRGHRAAVLFATLMAAGQATFALSSDGGEPPQGCTPTWALEESFDGDPASPSRELLPASFDFSVTHRTHPRDHDPVFPAYPADHGLDCAGPAPPVPAQHDVHTSHLTSGAAPDESFFVCKNHMMSSMGDVEGYSVTAFWPRQSFDFTGGGVLELAVNIDDGHPRSWWEILIVPREQLTVGAAQDWLPIDETYPAERIVLTFHPSSKREIQVGTGVPPPDGWIAGAGDWRDWRFVDPTDPALDDRRIRRRMQIELGDAAITWSIERADGTMDPFTLELPDGLPFHEGLVLFKTHAYTPEKDGNLDRYTFHWDDIRFDGPVVGRYASFETTELGYLQANGSRPIGDATEMTIELPRTGPNPVLFGQVHGALTGQVRLSVNGGAERVVHPYAYTNVPGCASTGWTSFRVPLDPSELAVGANTFRWTVGPRPPCASWHWDGFSIKGLEIQLDL